tara:strand:- start:176128 stop:177573 length:1446 start_codon:yes stop_codon:yes gene_type:complete
MKKIASLILASILGGGLALGGYFLISNSQGNNSAITAVQQPQVLQTNYIPTSSYVAEATDFTKAAEETVNAVVHVKNVAIARGNPLAELFYGASSNAGEKAIVGTGSGVIISPDGYIITNNHVINGAENIEVTLNDKKTYKATVVGAHESSDIALLKVDATDLPFVTFGNSDAIKVGEWVLAVGNPFNLTSTVTAGIVSAKARDIHISRNSGRIESFIQTDAAVNPGNSGGALVNVRGELIGINSAITSQTGSYVGYSFAVPSNIAKKVVEDIIEFGDVQTAYLGINFAEINAKTADDLDLSVTEGVLITDFPEKSRAKEAGLEKDDIIIKTDNIKISKFSDLQGFLSAKRPGDSVVVTVLRKGVEKQFKVKLANQFGKESFGKYDFTNYNLGTLKSISKKNASKFRIDYGVEITDLKNNKLKQEHLGIQTGDLLLKIDNKKVYTADDVEAILRDNKGKEVVLQFLKQNETVEYIKVPIQN